MRWDVLIPPCHSGSCACYWWLPYILRIHDRWFIGEFFLKNRSSQNLHSILTAVYIAVKANSGRSRKAVPSEPVTRVMTIVSAPSRRCLLELLSLLAYVIGRGG